MLYEGDILMLKASKCFFSSQRQERSKPRADPRLTLTCEPERMSPDTSAITSTHNKKRN